MSQILTLKKLKNKLFTKKNYTIFFYEVKKKNYNR